MECRRHIIVRVIDGAFWTGKQWSKGQDAAMIVYPPARENAPLTVSADTTISMGNARLTLEADNLIYVTASAKKHAILQPMED